MPISRLQIIGSVALLVVALSVASRAQDQKSPSQEQRARAINLVRSINTAEIRYSMGGTKDAHNGHGRFASWSELYSSRLVNDLQVSSSPEVIPGYHLDVLASVDGKSFLVALHDTKEGEGLFSVFSDQSGIIFVGAPLR
jgi:hypothetical protein